MNDQRTSSSFCAETVPARRYELISYRGEIFGPYPSAQAAAEAAKEKWPHLHQDEEHKGIGWDIAAVTFAAP